MHVSELLLQAKTMQACEPAVCFELLRHAELHGISSARVFLLHLAARHICPTDTVWALRTVFNSTNADMLWVPLTFSLAAYTSGKTQ